jgi:hypothetical protein
MPDGQLSPLKKVDLGEAPQVTNVNAPAPSAIPEQPVVPPLQLGNNPSMTPMMAKSPPPAYSNEVIANSLTGSGAEQNNEDASKGIKIIQNVLTNPNPKNKLEAASHIEEKNKLDKDGHINTQTQWGGVIASLLNHDAMGAWKYYNGGPTRLEDAYSPIYGHAYKEFNANGTTGKLYNRDGTPVDPTILAKIEKSGGYFQSKSDTSALQDAKYQGASELVKKAMTGLPSVLMDQTELATKMAGSMSEIVSGANKLKQLVVKPGNDFLNSIAQLPSDARQKLLSATNLYVGFNKGASAGQAAGANNSATGQLTNANSLGGSVGGSFGGGGAVPAVPPSAGNPAGSPAIPGVKGIGVDINGNLSSSASNANTSSANTTANAARTQSESQQTQQALQDTINGFLGGKAINADQFYDLQTYLNLTSKIDQTHDYLKANNLMAPGSTMLSSPDPRLSGTQNAYILANEASKNASLASAYANYKAHLANITNGMLPEPSEIAAGFLDSKTFEAINNHYSENINNLKNGVKEQKKHKVGDIGFDPMSNKPIILNNQGKWVYYNE